MSKRQRRIAGLLAVVVGAAALLTVATCHRKRAEPSQQEVAAQLPPPPRGKEPDRTAVGDRDLRAMLAALVSSKACAMIDGAYRPLRAADRPGVVTGVLHIRGCKITAKGTAVTFALSGEGWQWAQKETTKVGATFALHQYVRFAMDAKIPGALDLGYDPDSHVASVWFSPTETPDVTFTPVGDLEVDKEGAWSSVVGAVSSVFLHSPEEMAHGEAVKMGTQQMQLNFAKGLSMTMDLCTGVGRFNLGRPASGAMIFKDVGETERVPVEVQPGGLMMFGPELAGKGFSVHVRTSGPVRTSLACADAADGLSHAYAAGGTQPPFHALASKVVNGEATLRIPHPSCKVIVVAQSLAKGPVELDWVRPAAQKAAGPLIQCQ